MKTLPSAEFLEVSFKILERFGLVSTALLGVIAWLLIRYTRKPPDSAAGSQNDSWRLNMDVRLASLSDRVSRLEAVQQDRWDLMRQYILPTLKQPVHRVMDALIDKIDRGAPLALEEWRVLRDELEQRLREPEPQPNYHLKCLLSLDWVRDTIRRREREEAGGTC